MKVGISTACLYPMVLEDSLQCLLEQGFRHFEIFFNTCSETEPAYVQTLMHLLNRYQATVKSVHPFTSGYESLLLFSGYERRFLDTVEFYKRYFEAARMLGAKFLVLHGQRVEKERDMTAEAYYEHYHQLLETGRQFGITVAQENVNLFRSSSPAFLSNMRTYLHGDCAFVLDIKQAVRSGHSPFETCAAMGEQLVHVHMNDNRPGQDCLLPGAGSMDYPRFCRQLAAQHFRGDCIIEVYRTSFRQLTDLLPAKRTVEQMRDMFQSLTKEEQTP